MSLVTVFFHERVDGGRRLGLTVDGGRALEVFFPGDPDDYSPILSWYVDVAYTTDVPPQTQEDAVEWMDRHADEVRRVLRTAASDLGSGIDLDLVPWSYELPGRDGPPIRISLSATRRHTAVSIAQKLRELADSADWAQLRPFHVGL